MDVAHFFKTLSNLTMEAKYQAQDACIIRLLKQTKTERKKMQIKSEGCAQIAQSKMSTQMPQSNKSHAPALADEIDGLAELAKFYNILANMLGEFKDAVAKRWKIAWMKGFNAAIEDVQAAYDDVLEVKRRGVDAVANETNFLPKRDSHRKCVDVHNEDLAKDPAVYGGYVPKEGE